MQIVVDRFYCFMQLSFVRVYQNHIVNVSDVVFDVQYFFDIMV